ncbi:hypothetical protein ABR737_39140 [Streptomyces sp. Edi2]
MVRIASGFAATTPGYSYGHVHGSTYLISLHATSGQKAPKPPGGA